MSHKRYRMYRVNKYRDKTPPCLVPLLIAKVWTWYSNKLQ